MNFLSDKHFRKIAVHLITFKNHRIQYRLKKNQITLLDLFDMNDRQLRHLGFSQSEITELKSNYKKIAEREIQLCIENGIELIFTEDEHYPELLMEIFDPPEFIYSRGDKSVLKSKKIAVVGSRAATPYGRNVVERLIPELSRAGLTVVSGMAYGIDSWSQHLAMKAEGKTIGVNAGGLLNLYPAGNRSLINNILSHGCIISEFPLETVPRPFFFPIRNRIIAGLVPVVLVIEAALKSGSLVTARLALEQNRDVFAVPGPINAPLSQGTNDLILHGAKLVRCARDIFEEYGIEFKNKKNRELDHLSLKEKRILDLLDTNEVKGIDYFVENLDFSVSEIISLLMGMVLKKIIIQDTGGYKKLS
jgi:DNA processing protein